MIDGTNPRILADNIRDIKKQAGGLDSRVTALEVTAPKDYSTTETATGQKWIDGKDVYCVVLSSALPEIGSTPTNILLGELTFDKIICSFSNVYSAVAQHINRFSVYGTSANTLYLYQIPNAFSEGNYIVTVYYTKPDPVPGDAKGPEEPEPEPEVKETKTKKKTTK